jgi:hypothetical protein
MGQKDQFLEAYGAGKEAYRAEAAKRPPWGRLILLAIPTGGLLATNEWLVHHSSLSGGWRFAIAVVVGWFLMVLCPLALDKLRKSSGL